MATTDYSKLSAKKLHEVIAKREARWSEMLDAVIKAGWGNARYSDIVEMAKGSSLLDSTKLAQDYLNARHDVDVVRDELDARRRWHGSDKPIKRPVSY